MIKSKNMNIQINDDIKSRFLLGECTDEELTLLRDWMKANPEEAKELFGIERLYDELKEDAFGRAKIGKEHRGNASGASSCKGRSDMATCRCHRGGLCLVGLGLDVFTTSCFLQARDGLGYGECR